jgi:antitoxin Phd
MVTWQLRQAKTRLGELIEEARTSGPQIVIHRGSEHAVVLSIEDYRALVSHRPNLIEYLLGGPKVEGFDVASSSDLGREIEL